MLNDWTIVLDLTIFALAIGWYGRRGRGSFVLTLGEPLGVVGPESVAGVLAVTVAIAGSKDQRGGCVQAKQVFL